MKRVGSRNATFQQWQAYLTNRNKRHRDGRFLIHGVRPITLAVEHRWPLEVLLYRDDGRRSAWARDLLAGVQTGIAVAPELIAELGEKDGEPPEVVAVARTRDIPLRGFTPPESAVVVVFDRPASPGNLGTLIRSADAFGAAAVIVSGHGADQYDPRCVRASTGSLFAVPVFRVSGPDEVLGWRSRHPAQIVGTDESGAAEIATHDFTGPTVLVVGNETRGLSAAWRDACDECVHIPIGGAASSLGAPSAGAVCLYEIDRQRRSASP
ncbi:MAG TPA: TrmH family RNA methyltransferase [Aldersonia sp.]